MNIAFLTGRLTRDPDVRYTTGREPLCIATFNLAVDRPVSKGSEKQTDFPRIKAFGKQAENIEKYIGKGSKVAVQGAVETGEYEKDGRKIYFTEIVASRVEFLDTRSQQTQQTPAATPQQMENFQQLQDDDIPW